MAGLSKRLRALEEHGRERAIAEVEALLKGLSDEEIALIATVCPRPELVPAREALEERIKAAGIDGLLEAAVRPEECSEEDIGRRIKDLTDRAMFSGRQRHRLQEYVRQNTRDHREEEEAL